MPSLPADDLRPFAQAVIAAVATPPDLAQIVGDSLVDANLAGHDSHGVLRLPGYIRSVSTGDVLPTVRPTLLSRDRATARLDGGWGWGQPAMRLATEQAIVLAAEFGLGAAVVHRCYHIGRVAPYVDAVARAGMVGLAMTNAGPAVAPFQGRQRVLGTNPIAWAVPRGDDKPPIIFDGATAGIPEGKLLVARANGVTVAPGLLVDKDGRPTAEPADFYDGGALLPFGGHKGYGFSVFVQLLGRALAGMDTTGFDGPRGANGPLILALDVSAFTSLAQFTAEVDAQSELIAASPPASDAEQIFLPGDPELLSRRQRQRHGIPIADSTWQALTELAVELGVSMPGPIMSRDSLG